MKMDGFLSFLLFAVLFYVMMRFGCGAHMVHGRHGGHGDHGSDDASDAKHEDPVCGKHVSPHEGYGKMHADRLYRFCSRQCLDAFETDPDRYTTKQLEATS
jgi:YHS domain-containing protein